MLLAPSPSMCWGSSGIFVGGRCIDCTPVHSCKCMCHVAFIGLQGHDGRPTGTGTGIKLRAEHLLHVYPEYA